MCRTKLQRKSKHTFSFTDSFSENRFINEIMWGKKNCVTGEAADGSRTRRMRLAYWITKARNTESGYVILIAFPQQQWIRESASVLYVRSLTCLSLTRSY